MLSAQLLRNSSLLELRGRIKRSRDEHRQHRGIRNHRIGPSCFVWVKDNKAHARRLGERIIVVRVNRIREAWVLHYASRILARATLPCRETRVIRRLRSASRTGSVERVVGSAQATPFA